MKYPRPHCTDEPWDYTRAAVNTAAPVPEDRPIAGRPARALAASVRRYLRDSTSYQRFAYAVGALLLLSGLVHAGIFLIDGGAWQGPVSWRKAVTFGLSFGVTMISVAWVLTFLPERRAVGWILMGLFGLANTVEVGLVTLQAWRRQPSHFNTALPFDTSVFVAMGISVAVIALVIVAVAVWSWGRVDAPSSLRLAIRAGLLLLVASQVLGYAIIDNGLGILEQEGVETPVETTRDLSHLGAHGALKVPHAVTIHGLQVLPGLAWLAQFTRWSERRRTRIVATSAVAYAGLCFVSGWQAFHGVTTIAFDPGVSAVAALSLSLLIAAFVAVLAAVARQRTHTPAV
jgi:hypothetical protein